MIKIINNDEIMSMLQVRDEIVSDLLSYKSWDDEEVLKIKSFIKKYNKLTQVERDLYYMWLQVGMTKMANMYGIGISTAKRRIKVIKKKMQ